MFFVLALLLTLTLALPAPAAAGDADLWATINICDTEAYPNVLGVRASMPGNRTRQKMWMRFRATYYDRATEEVKLGIAVPSGGSIAVTMMWPIEGAT